MDIVAVTTSQVVMRWLGVAVHMVDARLKIVDACRPAAVVADILGPGPSAIVLDADAVGLRLLVSARAARWCGFAVAVFPTTPSLDAIQRTAWLVDYPLAADAVCDQDLQRIVWGAKSGSRTARRIASPPASLAVAKERAMWEAIATALREHDGNVAQAARSLKISVQALQKHLVRFKSGEHAVALPFLDSKPSERKG